MLDRPTGPDAKANAAARPTAARPRRDRLAVRLARGVAGTLGAGLGLAVAWLVLVTVRFEPAVAYRNPVAARLDVAVAAGRSAGHMVSVATWVGYVAMTVVLGGVVFRTLLDRRAVRAPLRPAVVAGVAAAVAAVPLRAAEVAGAGLRGIDGRALEHVATSPFGGAMALRAAGLLLIGVSLRAASAPGPARVARVRWPAIAGRVGGLALVVASYLVIGHAQATDPALLEVVALAVHIVAAAVWFGGVVVLARELRSGGRAGRLPAAAIARFSRTAEAMVVLVLVSGVVLAEGQNVLTTAPWRTGYGLAFTVKLGFVAVVLAIGGYNRQRVVPAIAGRDAAAARRHLRATCVVEALVISMGVLLMTAAMTSGGF